MACKSEKFYFLYIWRSIASHHLVFMKSVGQPHESPFYFQKLKKIKNLVTFKSYDSLKTVYRFPIFAEKYWRQQNYGILGTNWYIFKKALMVYYYCTKFFPACPYPEIWGTSKYYPPRFAQTLIVLKLPSNLVNKVT